MASGKLYISQFSQYLNHLMRCPREAKIILEFIYSQGAWEPTSAGLDASHSDVDDNKHFVMTPAWS